MSARLDWARLLDALHIRMQVEASALALAGLAIIAIGLGWLNLVSTVSVDVWAGSVDIRERSEALGAQRPLPRMDPSNASSIGSCAMQITFRLPFDQDVSKGAT
jgi:hypothetical protein